MPSPDRPTPLSGKKLGILLSRKPQHPAFRHGVRLAQTALNQGLQVYLYCIDDALHGLDDPELQALQGQGLNLFACAYGAHKRRIPLTDAATFGGLGILSDIITATDRFLSFN